MVFGRQWLVLDLSRGSVRRQFGLLVPIWTEERLLSEFNAVVISHDPGDSDSAETYPVRLRASIERDIVMVSPLQFGESRRMAEYLAQTLHLPLSDTTSDHVTTVDFERANACLRDRLNAAAMSARPPRPPIMRCEVEESTAATNIVIPSGGPKAIGYLGALLPLVVILIALPVAVRFLTKTETPPGVKFLLLSVLVLIFGVPAIFAGVRLMVVSRRRKTMVTASPSGLVIAQPQGHKTLTTVIAANDLLDIDYMTLDSAITSARRSVNTAGAQSPDNDRVLAMLRRLVPNPGIIVKSRSSLIKIGEGLRTNELEYLVWLLRKALI